MSKLRNPVIPDYTPKKKEQVEIKLDLRPCLMCNKQITDGYYARYGESGTCSKKCMIEQDKKPKYPGHTEEEFLQRLGESNE